MEPIEVRLLGPLQVRRGNGSVVRSQEWRTTKTLDLLRLLALHNGQPVAVCSVIDKLWPDVDEARGRASLRTAASQLRKVLDADCVERREASVLLRGAWVDTRAYEALAEDVEASRRAGDRARTVALVQEAEALFVGDLVVPDSTGDWLYEWQERLRRLRCRMLIDAADATASLCWMRDSLGFAERAYGIEACEEATRALMRAHAGVGEVSRALEVFDRTRRDLASRFGVDPSPQTRALHLQLITGTAARVRTVGLVGHEETVDGLAMTLSGILRADPGVGVVWLEGEPGSGRDSVVAAACRQAGLSMHDMGRDSWLRDRSSVAAAAWEMPATDVVVMPHTDSVPPHAAKLLDTLARQQGGAVVVPVRYAPQEAGTERPGRVPHAVVRIPALTNPELEELAEAVLQGEPSARLLRRLRAASGGLGGAACRTAAGWLEEGRVVWTVDGLELVSATPTDHRVSGMVLHRRLRLLDPFAEVAVQVVVVAGRDLTADEVAGVVAALGPEDVPHDVEEALDRLVDAGLLAVAPGAYRLRDPHARTELLAWMRPRRRRQIHLAMAERLPMPLSERLRHLIAGGRHAEAEALGANALERARAAGDAGLAHALVEVLAEVPPGPTRPADLPRQPGPRRSSEQTVPRQRPTLSARTGGVVRQARQRLYGAGGSAYLLSELDAVTRFLAG